MGLIIKNGVEYSGSGGGGGGGGGSYELPIASESTLGGVKVGAGLAIDQSGVLSSTGLTELFHDNLSLVKDGNQWQVDYEEYGNIDFRTNNFNYMLVAIPSISTSGTNYTPHPTLIGVLDCNALSNQQIMDNVGLGALGTRHDVFLTLFSPSNNRISLTLTIKDPDSHLSNVHADVLILGLV